MDHIRQHDWCQDPNDRDDCFLKEFDLDNCTTEKILRNKFRDPLISSDEEEEKTSIDWNQIFKRNDFNERLHRLFVPGLRAIPPFPKKSALTDQEHYQCLKVLCAEYPEVLKGEFMPRPTKSDHKVFQELKSKYETEQKEFLEWAKSLWVSNHCVRALRPKPIIEMVYEAEFKNRAKRVELFPKEFEMAAQISLETPQGKFDMSHPKDLIKLNVKELPQIEIPELTAKKVTVLRPCPIPEPCNKHPCKFILPNDRVMSVLPLTEVHQELAQWSWECGARAVCSEAVLKCLVDTERHWTAPLSVCPVIGADGETTNVIVLGSEFCTHRESAQLRTYKAYRHLLEYSFIPATEKELSRTRVSSDLSDVSDDSLPLAFTHAAPAPAPAPDDSSDDEDLLVIDTGETVEGDPQVVSGDAARDVQRMLGHVNLNNGTDEGDRSKRKESVEHEGDHFYTCTCKDSMFESPPKRSFRKWQLRNLKNGDRIDVVVHCAHKVRDKSGEVVLEPIPEYQLDLAGSRQSHSRIRSLALSLMLRKNATLMNVRVDSTTGEVIAMDSMQLAGLCERGAGAGTGAGAGAAAGADTHDHGVANVVYTVISQLSGLVPGQYLVRHEPGHGPNALLYSTRLTGRGDKLTLQLDFSQLPEADEAKSLQPPDLAPVLMPSHKFRKILPCAFSPFQVHVSTVHNKRGPAAKPRAPPQAIVLEDPEGAARGKWPKRKNHKKRRAT